MWYADHVCVLIPFERVWTVFRLEQSPTGDVLEPVRGTPIRDVPKRGKIVPKRGLPNFKETAGYTLA